MSFYQKFFSVILLVVFCLPSMSHAADFTASWQPQLVSKPGDVPAGRVLVFDARAEKDAKEFIPSSLTVDWKSFYNNSGTELLPADRRKTLFEALGVTGHEKIVIYDNGPKDGGAFMLFWLLEASGHQYASVLDGGFPAYKAAKLPLADKPAKPKKDSMSNADSDIVAMDLPRFVDIFGEYDLLIIDPRSDEEYNGWPLHKEARGGHIRTALNFDPIWAYNADGMLKPEQDIRLSMYRKGITPEKRFFACSNFDTRGGAMYYLLRVMGYKNISHAAFTLNEWAENPLLPMASAPNWKVMVSPEWLDGLTSTGKALTFENKKFAVYEVSWGTLEKAAKAYKAGHIPTAFHLNSDTFEDERHYWDLFTAEELFPRLAAEGIDKDTTVIVYGHGADTISASIAFWALKTAGVNDVRILNGNFDRWVAKGLPVEMEINTPKPVADFGLKAWGNPQYHVSIDQAKALLKDPRARVVSIRHWHEYNGQVVLHSYIKDRGEALGTYWGRAGYGKNTSDLTFYFDPDGSYRSYSEVAKMWADLDVLPSHKVAFSCGTGARASTGWLYSYLMGWPDAALFDSGWFGWSGGKEKSPNPKQNIWDSVNKK